MPDSTPTQTIWFKNKRVLRTLFSGILTGLVVIPQVLAIINDAWPSSSLTFVIVQSLALQAAVTRIMAIDAVNVALSSVGLGSAPKGELTK